MKKQIRKIIKKPSSLRNKIVISFFMMFLFFFFLLITGLFFLSKAGTVSIDQIQTVSEIRMVSMFMNLRFPGDWSVQNGRLFKGDVSISDNNALITELAKYLRPGSHVYFQSGAVPENVEELSFSGINPLTEIIINISKKDIRLKTLIDSHNRISHPRKQIPPVNNPQDSVFSESPPETPQIYILAGGIIDVIQSGNGENIGWIRLERESFGQGILEKWIFRIIITINILIISSVLFLAYRIIFRISEPISNLEKRHKEIIIAKKSLDDISRRDPLTGLLNRRGFELALSSYIFPSGRKTAAVAIIDLDNFKKINDIFGHPCGDYILKQVSRIVAEKIREGDIACRWGGEEFVIFYSEIKDGNILETAERIRHSISIYSYAFEGKQIHVTATIGVSVCMSTSEFNESIERADAALYKGKKEGKNRVVLF
ncbi:MAG: GGDEF domain-containing protein [Spirochaetes bacterium]|nr:GGDEF domain-containing protein [Spirochaetota bacterium]